jgi:serine/threonine-protein kinase
LAFAHDFTDPETGEALELIHRDISPDNILLSRQGAVKVVDFGIAKAVGQGTRTESGVIKGKLAYMPPEQLRAEELDRRADVYALGVVLYELLTARRPFTSSTDAGLMQAILFSESVPAVQFRPDLPEALQRILERALAKEREQRYPDCHSFQADLEDFILLAGRPVVTQQIAQLITQSTSSIHIPVSQPQPGIPSNRPSQTVTPVHTPAPVITNTEVGAYSAPTTVKTPRPRVTTTTVVIPKESSEPATVYSRGPREPHPPDDLETLQHRELVKRWRSRRWELTLLGVVLLAAGSGVVLWRTTPEPKLQEATLKAESPPPIPTAPAPAPTDNAKGGVPATPSDPSPTEPQDSSSAPNLPLSKLASPSPQDATTQEQEQKPASPSSIPQDSVPPKNARSSRVGGTPKSKRAALASSDPSLNGTLRMRISPPATVFVDGEELGDTPMEPVALQAGRHTVTLINHKLSKIEERVIEVKPGQPTLLEINFHEE